MKEYYGNSDLTKETLFEEEGVTWLLTGDSIELMEDGTVFMRGRADDILNVGGEKVSPVEVSEVASMYDGIIECACIGEEDDILGQHPVLFVVPDDSYREDDCIRFLSKKLERYKLPTRFITLSELPKNSMSKIDKKKLLTKL